MPLISRDFPAAIKLVFYKVPLDEIMNAYANDFTPDIWKYEYFCDVAKGQVIFELLVEATEEVEDATG